MAIWITVAVTNDHDGAEPESTLGVKKFLINFDGQNMASWFGNAMRWAASLLEPITEEEQIKALERQVAARKQNLEEAKARKAAEEAANANVEVPAPDQEKPDADVIS